MLEAMSVSLYESRVRQARRTLESERKKQGNEEQKAAKLDAAVLELRKKASKTQSPNMAAGYLS